uniref:Cytochrome P450 714B2-like n=1 Tax=Cicer arietinum TaxID=3827 RepID=A0A1S3DX52_CICAR|nr:cytochrome P450 714B2-like [Cicer arietinum]
MEALQVPIQSDYRVAYCSDSCQRQEEGYELLQMILDSGKNSILQDRFIVDNCRTLFFAGHETTANTASWCHSPAYGLVIEPDQGVVLNMARI